MQKVCALPSYARKYVFMQRDWLEVYLQMLSVIMTNWLKL